MVTDLSGFLNTLSRKTVEKDKVMSRKVRDLVFMVLKLCSVWI